LVEIELTSRGASPRFLVRASDSRAILLLLTVQELDTERNPVWIIGREGTNVSVHPASEVHLISRREATSEEIATAEPARKTGITLAIGELSYGHVPPGFYQPVPLAGAPDPLVVGRQYLVTALAGSELAWLEFEA
jgi:hypothetical protein